MNTYLHKHHIIPRHAGGTDDPANIVELSVEDHAEAHRILYEQHGRWQDYAAWQGLSKQTDRQDMRRLVVSLSTQEHSRKRVVDGTHHFLGGAIQQKKVKEGTHHLLGGANVKKLVEEGTHNFLGGAIQQRNNQRRIKNGTHNLLGSNSNKERLANGTHPSQTKLTCNHCKKTVSVGMFVRWHSDRCKLNHS
jgi:hypothetical protein